MSGKVIKVLDLEHETLCFKPCLTAQAPMERCLKLKGHEASDPKHSWEEPKGTR